MTGTFWLDWAILAVSLFNVILMLWLGLTVLLNADRKSRGVWLMGGGLLAGALFFVSHTAILGQEMALNSDGLNFWWHVGWLPVTVAPFLWYVVVLWYTGFWLTPAPPLRRRHLPWLLVMLALVIGLVALLILSNALPTYDQVIRLDVTGLLTLAHIPVAFVGVPALMFACIALSIDALLRPAPPAHPISGPARQRSQPWLLRTGAILLAVSLLVTFFIARILTVPLSSLLELGSVQTIGLFDLALSVLIAVATILLAQAIIAYEVFSGRSLPRQGLRRQWRITVLLALGYGLLVGWTLALHLRPIYSLLLTTLLMVGFYALYSWRSFVDRERFMARLRPFVASPGLLTRLFSPDDEASSRASALFEAVCRDVLGATQGQLIALGPLASLAGDPLRYPAHVPMFDPPLPDLKTEAVALDPSTFAGYHWAIPLWAERGLIGTFLVGGKRDGGVYAQEEIEIARAAGERIVDTLASEQVTRRLVGLQRQRLTETRVMDLQTRRALHDEVLPLLHAAALKLSASGEPSAREAIAALSDAHRHISDLIHSAHKPLARYNETVGLITSLRQMVDGEFAHSFDAVTWDVSADPPLDALAGEVLLGAAREAVRNAAVHGRGPNPRRPLHLSIALADGDMLRLTITDDGVGLDDAVSSEGGSGGGLTLHSTLVAVVGGTMTSATNPDVGTRVCIIFRPLPSAPSRPSATAERNDVRHATP